MKILTSLLIFVFLVVGIAQADNFEIPYQNQFETGDTASLILTLPQGSITIKGHDLPVISIEATKTVKAPTREEALALAERIGIEARHKGNKVEVTAVFADFSSRDESFWKRLLGSGKDLTGTIDMTILVPTNCDLKIQHLTGSISVHQIFGDVEIHSSTTDITLYGIEGSVSVDNGAGKLTGEMLFGPVLIRQPQGEINLQWIDGDVTIRSSSAAVAVMQEQGGLDLVSESGTVHIQSNLLSDRDVNVETESGDISFLIPELSSGTLELTSKTGDISSDIPVTIKSTSKREMVGVMGDGGIHVSLRSMSGNVSVSAF